MISAGEFRKGITIEIDNSVYQVVDFQHVKPGKGAAFVRTRLKNVITGGSLERTFNPNEKYTKANLETKTMEYLYSDGELYHFMEKETYEQQALNYDAVEDVLKYIKENDVVTVKFFKGSAFSVECDNFVALQVTECDPGIAGNTATNAMKSATVETGAIFQVPMFVNEGDVIRIDTRNGEYMERVK